MRWFWYPRWSAFVAVIALGSCMYVLISFTFSRFDHYKDVPSPPHSRIRLAVLRDTTYSIVDQQPPADLGYSFFALNSHYNLSFAYYKNWVGFPDFQTVNCQKPLKYPTLNRQYPTRVNRKYPTDFTAEAKDCQAFINNHGFSRYPQVSQEELDFPLAFILLFHADIDQVVFLLRAIYRPHNVYCLFVDTKSSVDFLEATRSVARCLPNVFISSKLESIVYAGYSRLMADIHCLRDLINHRVKWKYVINSPGQAFPLRTNLEMVKILKVFNGTNDIESNPGSGRLDHRYTYRFEYIRNQTNGDVILNKTTVTHSPPPHKLEIVKCSVYACLSRAFVEFILTSRIAKDLLEWAKPVFSPDELYWATLNFNTIVPAPGGFRGVPKNRTWLASYSLWEGDKRAQCVTKYVRGICIFTPGDLPNLMKQRELFANKFHIDHHPVALHCLDQLIYNLTFSRAVRDMDYYESQHLASPRMRRH
ncbi:unnamed protein product [Candidula unifasciata]|uniref:Uncharacterized protein n=1 Tax=Candidula unifasciata TaxID=100452 RepID=A0A8S4AGC1_9EUPU|nr:unnamed protein product [Candidula unifasciata]